MKGLLLDENLPARLLFSPSLPVVPLSSIGANPTDSQIWEFARQHELVIVSKDADFSDRIIVQMPPPWVVHIRFGNLRKKEFHALLARLWPQIEMSLKTCKLVNVYSDRVEGIG
jgi:predicted nuclease of predicted toxin-antitoxin system